MLKKTAKPSSPSFLNNLHVKKNKQPNLHALHFFTPFMLKKNKEPNLHFSTLFMLK
jgi:hypothetical protein